MGTRYAAECTDCNFTGTYHTEPLAWRALNTHSCERHRRRAAARQSRLDKLAKVDRTPQPCHHPNTTHVHGTHACYVLDRCRCLPCARANTAYENERARLQAYGRWNGLVDAEPAREHIRSLMDQGMGLKRIGEISGVPHGSLSKLMYGVYAPGPAGRNGNGILVRQPSKRIRPTNAEKLLAVQLDLAGGAKVDGLGTRRRLQALTALGFSHSFLGRQIGVQNIYRTIHGIGDGLVMKTTADKTRDLYDRLSMTLNQPTSKAEKVAATRARNYAREQGWLPPLAWDDEHIDDPGYTPTLSRGTAIAHDVELDEAAIYRRMHGDKSVRLSKADAAELVRRCRAAQWSWNDIEHRTGLKPDRYEKPIKIKENQPA